MLNNANLGIGVFQFSLEGKMMGGMVEELREAILPVISQSQAVEIDLSQVAGIDHAGVLLMVDAKLTAVVQGKQLRFVRYSKPVTDILESSGLVDFFGVSYSEME